MIIKRIRVQNIKKLCAKNENAEVEKSLEIIKVKRQRNKTNSNRNKQILIIDVKSKNKQMINCISCCWHTEYSEH